MNKWIVRIGYFFIIIGVLSFAAVAHYLPIEFILQSIGISEEKGGATLYKVVPNKNSNLSIVLILISGAVMVLFGMLLKSRQKNR
jgi:hypothetical protein